MGYKIVYGRDPMPKNRGTARVRGLTAAFMLIFVILVRCAWPRGTDLLRRALEPGENTVTAFSEMVSSINGGEAVGEAVTAFCRRMVDG